MASTIIKDGSITANVADSEDPDKVTRTGLVQYLIADVGGAVNPHRTRGHLGDGHDVSESALGQPSVSHNDLCLDERQHSVAAAEGEQSYHKENPEKLEDKSKLSHF